MHGPGNMHDSSGNHLKSIISVSAAPHVAFQIVSNYNVNFSYCLDAENYTVCLSGAGLTVKNSLIFPR